MSSTTSTKPSEDLAVGDVIWAPTDAGTRTEWRTITSISDVTDGEWEIAFAEGPEIFVQDDEEWTLRVEEDTEDDGSVGSILFTMGGEDDEQIEYRAQIITLATFERDYHADALLAGAGFEFAGEQYVVLRPTVAR